MVSSFGLRCGGNAAGADIQPPGAAVSVTLETLAASLNVNETVGLVKHFHRRTLSNAPCLRKTSQAAAGLIYCQSSTS